MKRLTAVWVLVAFAISIVTAVVAAPVKSTQKSGTSKTTPVAKVATSKTKTTAVKPLSTSKTKVVHKSTKRYAHHKRHHKSKAATSGLKAKSSKAKTPVVQPKKLSGQKPAPKVKTAPKTK